jgi:hypothetical protein
MRLKWSSTLTILLLVMVSSLTASVNTALALSTCDSAQFIADVTVPDGTYIDLGATFVKTWRLKNTGVCQWNTSYTLVFSSGEKMGTTDSVPFPQVVLPGQTVDLTVTLTAPTMPGTFRGYWQLKNSSGGLFGIGASHSNPFWVEIKVTSPTQTITAYDFADNMCSAQWSYDGGPIPCPLNPNKLLYGYVQKIDNPVMENGITSPVHGLLTIPQSKYNGLIRGSFPVTDIFRGDHFQALIGCQYNAVNCYVTYMLEYQVGDSLFTLWKSKEKYDGLVTQADVDLTRIANLKAKLVLTILATGPYEGDQPLWVGARIVRTAAVPVTTPTPVSPTSVVPTTPPTSTSGCDRAQFISDVTVPDGTTFAPNAPFTKTWRLKNVGTCTWTTGYSLAFVSGDRMGGADSLLPVTVVPGQTVDVGVNLTAPSVAGSYRGYWQFRNASGALFGIGSNADQPFYVDIKVSGSSSGGSTAYDFVSNVCSAQWFNGTVTLPCPGTDGDPRGFVLSVANPVLENGVTDSRPGLLTSPQNVYNGQLAGIYPTIAVQVGDHFQATLDCQYGAADCFVIFRLDAEMAGGVTQNMATYAEKYDGLYNPVDIDLSSLAGKNVNFILTVLANGPATGDRAMWVGAKIVHTLAIGGSLQSAPTQTEIPVTSTPVQLPTLTSTPIPLPSDTSTPVLVPTDTSTTLPPNPSDTPMPTNTP